MLNNKVYIKLAMPINIEIWNLYEWNFIIVYY